MHSTPGWYVSALIKRSPEDPNPLRKVVSAPMATRSGAFAYKAAYDRSAGPECDSQVHYYGGAGCGVLAEAEIPT